MLRMATTLTGRSRPQFRIVLVAVLVAVVALLLRMHGLGWDQGNFFHPDERSLYLRADCMYLTLANDPRHLHCANPDFPPDEPGMPSPATFFDAERSPLNPHWFPLGSVLIYVLVSVRAALEIVMDQVRLQDMAMAGRILAALADTGSVLLLFALGARLYGWRVGLLASLLGAFSVGAVQLAHFYRPEPFTTLLVLASLWFMADVMERGRWRDHLRLGVAVGLSFALKATSVHLLGPLVLTYGVVIWKAWGFYRHMVPFVGITQVVGQGVVAASAALLVFGVLQPYAFLDYRKFAGDLAWETSVARTAGLVPYTLQYVGVPNVIYELRQTSLWALGLPLGVAAWAGLAATALAGWWRPKLGDYLLLAWAVPALATVMAFEVKFLRYVAPAMPVLIILGSRWMVEAHCWAKQRSATLAHGTLAVAGFVVCATIFYSLAFQTVYTRDHPAVQASMWVRETIPPGSVLLTDNHWDEGFPDLHGYVVRQLPMYEADTLDKLDGVVEELANADYLLIYSNRPFGSITRLPERFPLSSSYYQRLFSGDLGYELDRAFASYPALAGISFVHDPFTRATVQAPENLPGAQPRGIVLRLGYADENITNYDHPLVLVFRNVERLEAVELLDRILLSGSNPQRESLLLSQQAWQVQRGGGTWTELFSESGWTNRFSWLVWLGLVEAIGLVALPLAVVVLRRLPDRGVVLARPVALLVLAWLTWFGASVGWWPFDRSVVLWLLVILSVVSLGLLYKRWPEVSLFLRARWRYLVGVEVLFIVAYLVFVVVRAANPDLWHPWRGGEKPMDLAYLTAVVRSTTMPPYDPWYAGGYLNYYYFGQFMSALLVKVSGIVPTVGYNLAIPTFFAVTFTTAFSVGYNLTEALRRRAFPHRHHASTLVAGASAAVMVTVLGNLGGAGQLIYGLGGWIGGRGLEPFDYWAPSRLMVGQISITEFPFWTFLFADLHAHLMALPFGLLAFGLALDLALSGGTALRWFERAPTVALLALTVGALAAINTWDVPAYALVALSAGGLALVARTGPIGRADLLVWLGWSALTLAGAYLLFLPFHANYTLPFEGLRWSQWRTPFWQYAAIHGAMLLGLATWLAVESWRRLAPSGTVGAGSGPAPPAARLQVRWLMLAVAVSLGIAMGLAGFETLGVLIVLLGLAAIIAGWWLAHRTDPVAPVLLLVLVAAVVALGVGAGVDVVVLRNDIDRMNTVFKLYLSAWVLMAIAATVGCWHLWATRAGGGRVLLSRVWLSVMAMALLASAIFPVWGTRARLADRFPSPVGRSLTLEGDAYQNWASYDDPGPPGSTGASYRLADDADALDQLRLAVRGSPVVLEGVTTQYRWTPRVATYTGLPVVVGWEWHQRQQRPESVDNLRQRIEDVRVIYSTVEEERAMALLARYEVEYIYVGSTERLYYPAVGLAKFDRMVRSGRLERFYQNETVTIYRLPGG